MDSLVRLLLHLKTSKESKTRVDHVVRSDSFTVQLSPTFYEKRSAANRPPARLPPDAPAAVDASTPEPAPQLSESADDQTSCLSRQNVRYIFSSPIANCQRPTCLKMLQEPLRDVYLTYIDKESLSVPGVIDVLDNGLRIQYVRQDGTDIVDVFNEFHTIAYWAAVRCVVINSSHSMNKNARPGVQMGFFPFTENGQCVIQEYSTGGFLRVEEDQTSLLKMDHPPLFACVMRDITTPNSNLQCHVFLCVDPPQAITLASKLYESLKGNLSEKLRIQQVGKAKSSHKSCDQVTGSRKYATVVCSNCKRNAGNGNSRRGTSFSQFLSRLRRLTLSKDHHSSGVNGGNYQRSSRRRSSIGKKCGSIRKSFSNPILLPAANGYVDVSAEVDLLCNYEQERQSQTEDSDAGYHSIPQHVEPKPQLAKLSMATPHWMKILADIGSRQHQSDLMASKTANDPSDEVETQPLFETPAKKRLMTNGHCPSNVPESFIKSRHSGNFESDPRGTSVCSSEGGQTYAEIEEAELKTSSANSIPCSVVMDADLSSSDDELTERDSLESASSWNRCKRTKMSARQLQIETINRMLGLSSRAVATDRARSLSDLCLSSVTPPQKPARLSMGPSKPKSIGEETSENGDFVKKDAEIVSTLEQLYQPIYLSRKMEDDPLGLSLTGRLRKRVVLSKPKCADVERPKVDMLDNRSKQNCDSHWGWASFLP